MAGATDYHRITGAEPVVTAGFKWSTIVPVPKTASSVCLNDYRPVALPSVVMKCFERADQGLHAECLQS